MSRNDQQIGTITLSAESVEEVVRDLLSTQADLGDDSLDEVNFVPDDAPIVDSVLEYYRELVESGRWKLKSSATSRSRGSRRSSGPATVNSSTTRVADIGRAIDEHAIPLEPTMGVRDMLSSLVGRIRRRTLRAELEPEVVSLNWFECHVPPGGSTSIRWERRDGQSWDLGFRVFGSGLGEGRAVELRITESTEARTRCATSRLSVKTQTRLFEVDGRPSTEVTILETQGVAVAIQDPCPFCGRNRAAIDPFAYRVDPFLDLRGDDVPTTRAESLRIAKSTTLEAKFVPPGVDVSLGLKAGVTAEVSHAGRAHVPGGSALPAVSAKGGDRTGPDLHVGDRALTLSDVRVRRLSSWPASCGSGTRRQPRVDPRRSIVTVYV